MKRSVYNHVKNPLGIGIKLLVYLAMTVMTGLTYMDCAIDPTPSDLSKNKNYKTKENNLNIYYYYIDKVKGDLVFVSQTLSMLAMCILPGLIEDRKIMIKEVGNGTYKCWVY